MHAGKSSGACGIGSVIEAPVRATVASVIGRVIAITAIVLVVTVIIVAETIEIIEIEVCASGATMLRSRRGAMVKRLVRRRVVSVEW